VDAYLKLAPEEELLRNKEWVAQEPVTLRAPAMEAEKLRKKAGSETEGAARSYFTGSSTMRTSFPVRRLKTP
jgi:hypothetical protein